MPIGSRRRLRFRLALEFMAVAGLVNLLLLLVVIGVREDQYRSAFDRELILRAREVGREAAAELKRGNQVHLSRVDEHEDGHTAYFEVYDAYGALLGESAGHTGVDVPAGLLPGGVGDRPALGNVPGRLFGRPDAEFRVASVRVPVGDTYITVHAASSLQPVHAAIWGLRLLLLALVFPAATFGAGVAGWLISERIFRRIGQVARAAAELRGQPGQRLELPNRKDEIGDMVSEMNAMIGRLDAAFRAQRKFILDVTHELKTPVSIMLAEAQVLKRSSPVHEPERYRAFLSSVEEETRRLGQILENFLTLARSSHGETYIAESLVSVNEVVIEAASRWEDVGRHSGTRISLMVHEAEDADDDVIVRGDHGLLVTMVENLLGSVSDSAGPKRLIEIRVGREHDRAIVSVRALDPGTGQPPVRRVVNERGHEVKIAIVEGIVNLHAGSVRTADIEAMVSLPAVNHSAEVRQRDAVQV